MLYLNKYKKELLVYYNTKLDDTRYNTLITLLIWKTNLEPIDNT